MSGLRDERAEIVRALSEMRRAGRENTADYRELAEIQRKIEEVLHAYRLDVLRIGVAGQLHMTGELDEVLPLDDAVLIDRADPRAGTDQVAMRPEAIEARQDAQVQTLLKAKPFAFVILGGAHDLGDNIAEQANGCEYLVVTTREYRRAYEPDDRTPPVPHAGRSRPDPTLIPVRVERRSWGGWGRLALIPPLVVWCRRRYTGLPSNRAGASTALAQAFSPPLNPLLAKHLRPYTLWALTSGRLAGRSAAGA